jgi:prepilin-type N-terminal cleavage/methylation domain-containing protein/prepilin-type processing-associated H-X9-DG protein
MRPPRAGFTLLELAISLAVVCALLVILLPALSTARMSSHRALCAGNQRLLGQAWSMYVEANDGRFPVIHDQPAWKYGGVRFSRLDETTALLDHNLPLNRYLPVQRLDAPAEALFRCPADRGITGETGGVGTGDRTAFEAYGTSYRANAALLASRAGGGTGSGSGLHWNEITTAASRLVVMGDPFWYEVLESTGRMAAWHGRPDAGNLLFLDGSVRFVPVEPRPQIGAAVFDPLEPGLAFPLEKN